MADNQTPELGNMIPAYCLQAEDTSTHTTYEDTSLLQQRQVGTTRTLEANFEFHTPLRDGHFVSNEQVLSTFSDDGVTNPDFCMDIARALTSEIESDYRFSSNYPDVTNIEEPHSHYPGMQLLGFVGSEINSIIGQNIASNMEISINKSLQVNISDPGAPSENNRLGDDICVVAGSSSSNENLPPSNLSMNVFPSTSSLYQYNVVETKKTIYCVFCKKVIAEHLYLFESNTWYKCCICSFKCDKEDDFLKHKDVHTNEKTLGKIFNNDHFEPELHGISQTCNRCGERFQYRHLLEDHYIIHELHHYEFCRVCNRRITEHAKEIQMFNYECCECEYITNNISNFRTHLYTHSDLRIFKYDMCRKRYKHRSQLSRHLKTHRET